ncbi:hypothetical protein DNTS_007282 [Danionella cerebrum]|uniref:snRNA-activating protein complex subunit 1 n=1 Tax=Danionella cerebrum TaxID=2873325 RepID=A0A553RIZ7_9TELE|nr:hypothetical protein DNTS_007282 [Danionella translucida]
MAWRKQSEYFRAPFISDLEELLGRFQQTESVRFEDFSDVWREMDFCRLFLQDCSNFVTVPLFLLYSGIEYFNEKRAFTQVTFNVAYKYLLPPYSFQIRVGALYSIYGLYNTQVAWPKEKVRIALKDWYKVQTLIAEAESYQHLDIEIENVQNHYERLKKASLPTASVVTLLNLTDSVKTCVHEYQEWKDTIAAAKNKSSKKHETTQQSEVQRSNRHRPVEMAKSDSGSDHLMHKRSKKTMPSLKKRTCHIFSDADKDEDMQDWLLSAMANVEPQKDSSGEISAWHQKSQLKANPVAE